MKRDSMIYYVYGLFAPSDVELEFPRYIGKGCGNRAFCKPNRRSREVRDWITEELAGEEPWFDLLAANLFEDEALSLEVDLISIYRRQSEGGVLLNVTSGGGGSPGVKRSAETLAKMSAAALAQFARCADAWKDKSPEERSAIQSTSRSRRIVRNARAKDAEVANFAAAASAKKARLELWRRDRDSRQALAEMGWEIMPHARAIAL